MQATTSTSAPSVLAATTIGAAWLGIASRILHDGIPAHWDGQPILEVRNVTLDVATPSPDDQVIARFADPERLAWMHANFTDFRRVTALGDAASYASRLFDYARSGRDQVQWVIDRLRADPERRDAVITTFEPLTDTAYIPCVAMLDFWIPDGALHLVVTAHSIDFGTKGYANLVELAQLQRRVADQVGVPVGRLTVTIKSAHIYDPELTLMHGILDAADFPDRADPDDPAR
ncbi:thymidylate synthase [uncultured Amnibacterium sp.]|uniref:thymidylate synthase n=1 Tax=uncultured Amnibacterium sp. TaxID=1631851 RepID=UPI0035CA500F